MYLVSRTTTNFKTQLVLPFSSLSVINFKIKSIFHSVHSQCVGHSILIMSPCHRFSCSEASNDEPIYDQAPHKDLVSFAILMYYFEFLFQIFRAFHEVLLCSR